MESSGEGSSVEMDSLSLNQTIPGLGMNRFSLFNIFIKDALEKIMTGVSEEQYEDFFKNLTAFRKRKTAHLKMKNKLEVNLMNSIKSELETWIQDENLIEKFDKLDKLINDCELFQGKDTWRPNGIVSDHLRSHLMAVKLSHKNALEKKVREKEVMIETLKQEVGQMRSHVQSLECRLRYVQELSSDCSVEDGINDNIISQLKDL